MTSVVPTSDVERRHLTFEAERLGWAPTVDLVSFVFDQPKYDQERPVYFDAENPSNSISCNQARKLVRQIVAGLRAAGVKEGDCVQIHGFNDVMYPIFFLSIVGVGGVFTGTNPAYTQHELKHHMATAKVRFVITEPSIAGPLLRAAAENNIPPSMVRVFNPRSDPDQTACKPWTELLSHGESDWVRFDNLERCKNTTAARLFTSGTSGPPKAAMISHHNLISQHMMFVELSPKPYEHSAIVATPCFHAAAVPGTHVSALRAGYRVYIMRRFDLHKFLVLFEKYQCTSLSLVPPMAVAIIMSPFAKSRPFLKSARWGIIGAAKLDKTSQSRLRAMLSPGVPIIQGYGMTETTAAATTFPFPEDDDTGSVGRLLPGLTAKLVDPQGKNITGYNVAGELCLKGPGVISGYFEDPKATADAFDSEGYLKTGDIFYVAPGSHKFYIVDRSKELIKVRGFQVAPAELEAILLQHPQIVDVAVIGVPSLKGLDDESPRAYVVRRPGGEGLKLKESEVQAYLSERLASYKHLHGGVVFIDAIPKNPTGKILKRVLRDMAGKPKMVKL